jgi:hypothetical protein
MSINDIDDINEYTLGYIKCKRKFKKLRTLTEDLRIE